MNEQEATTEGKARPRPFRVNVRFNREEWGHLREQARITNKRPATLMRGLVMDANLKAVPRLPEDVLRAMKSFGGNLNQLAHQANLGRVDKKEIDALRGDVSQLLNAVRG